MNPSMIEQLKEDLPHIIHCLTAPEPQDDSEEEWERSEQLSSALTGWEDKYGDDLIDEIKLALEDLPRRLIGESHD